MNSVDVITFGVAILSGLILMAVTSRITGVELQLLISGVVMALLTAGAVLYLLGKSPASSL